MSDPFKPYTFLQWELVEPRGSGLHGQVYLARHRHTGDHFALKMMHLEDSGHASKVRRSLSTAKANYRIRHTNVVAVHDLGCQEDGRVWILMEWLEGRSVADQLALQRGRMSVPLALHIAIEAAWGIDAGHELGIIHRDIKPDNVWLTSAGVVKVLDFSLAKVIPEGIATTVQLGAMTGLGTVAYLAPEGLRPDAEADARLDVYALGLMLWQLIAGRHPFQDALRSTTELIRRQIYVDPEPLSAVAGLPAYVDDFMRRAIAKDPNQRFSTIAQMAQALMTLRDRLHADAEQGLFMVDVPPGEPPLPGKDPWTRRDYHAGHALPEHLAPRPVPDARVVIVEAAVQVDPLAGPAATQPLRRQPLAATQPLPPQPLVATQKLGAGDLPPPAPAAPSPPTPAGITGSPEKSGAPQARAATPVAGTPGSLPARDTSPAVVRDPGPRASRARLPALLMTLVIASALVGAIFTRGWRTRGAAPPQTVVAAPSPSVVVTVAPEPSSSQVAEAPSVTSHVLAPEPPSLAAATPPHAADSASPASTAPATASPRPRAAVAPRPFPALTPPPPAAHGPVFRSEN